MVVFPIHTRHKIANAWTVHSAVDRNLAYPTRDDIHKICYLDLSDAQSMPSTHPWGAQLEVSIFTVLQQFSRLGYVSQRLSNLAFDSWKRSLWEHCPSCDHLVIWQPRWHMPVLSSRDLTKETNISLLFWSSELLKIEKCTASQDLDLRGAQVYYAYFTYHKDTKSVFNKFGRGAGDHPKSSFNTALVCLL